MELTTVSLVLALILAVAPGAHGFAQVTDDAGASVSEESTEATAEAGEPEFTAESTEAPSSVAAIEPSEGAPSVDRLLERFDEMFESSGTSARVEIVMIKPEKTRTMRLRMWGEGEDRALIIVDAPPRDAGMATLRVGKNLWNYLPKISRTIRVPPSMMMGSWMGSDLTNDDLVRESSYRDDYTSELAGRSEDPPGWEVRLKAKPDVVGLWNRVDIVFSYDDELPSRAQFFDRKDRLSRTMLFQDVKDVGGRRIPMLMVIIPEREEGRRTELRYLNVEFDLDLDEDTFSLSRLERAR